ncbi:MAG: ABC transporter permease [Acidimicrobiaceae bacterium]|nr:ABC transporter permease [Acidimicrobiaceae bacterium]
MVLRHWSRSRGDGVAATLSSTDATAKEPNHQQSGAMAALKTMPLVTKAALAWLLFIIGAAIYTRLDRLFGQALPLQDPFYQGFLFGGASPTETPSAAHWLGTDVLSRDNFSRLLHGAWVSLAIAATVVAFGVVIGGLLGSFVGYVRGRWETVVMASMDVILAFPPLVLLLALVAIYKVRSLPIIALLFGVLSIPTYVRIARASTLGVASREFVLAAEAIGTRRVAILFREVIPNVLPALLAYALVNAGFVIVIEGTLSYLGLSVQIPEPTWGNMINEGRRDIRQTILPVFWPGLFLTLTVVSLNMLGDWFQQRVAVREAAL